MQGQSGTEYGGKHHLVGRHADGGYAQGCGHLPALIVERLADFVGFHLAYAPDVVAEHEAVVLVILVPEFGQVLVDDAVAFAEIDDFHGVMYFLIDAKVQKNV